MSAIYNLYASTVLDRYKEEIQEQEVDAAVQARRDNPGESSDLLGQLMKQARDAANEVAMSQIMKELQLLYGTTETTE